LCILQKNGDKLPNNKVLATELGGKTELKKYMKRVMPFVQLVKEKMEVIGLSALNLTLDFDEKMVLEDNREYLKNTLDVSNNSHRIFFDSLLSYIIIYLLYFYIIYYSA